jgi:hypothetical protein
MERFIGVVSGASYHIVLIRAVSVPGAADGPCSHTLLCRSFVEQNKTFQKQDLAKRLLALTHT